MTMCKLFLLSMFFAVLSFTAMAEPYLAVRSGQSCSTCHTNAAGGGMRNAYGNLFAQNDLPAVPVSADGDSLWSGTVLERFAVGGNARYSGRQFDNEDVDDNLNFDVDIVSLYFSAKVNEHVYLYLDQQVAPGGSLNRESWVQLSFADWYVKVGKLFLPFGWRLQDDTAFTRAATGVNFNSADNGIEVGFDSGPWEFQLSATNGTSSAVEVDDGKQFSFRGVYINDLWRVGTSANFNNTDKGDRTMYGLFAGLRTGPVSWLLEYDIIEDEDLAVLPDSEQGVGLIEANVLVAKGHNLKVTAEINSFDQSGVEDQLRYSAVWEFFPWSFTQLRIGARSRDSDDNNPALNTDEAFVQAHVFF